MKERRAVKSAVRGVKRPSCEKGAAYEQHCRGHATEREDQKAQYRLHFSRRYITLLDMAETAGFSTVSC